MTEVGGVIPMKCQFCDKILDKGDLGASTCQGCGDVFDQTQIVEPLAITSILRLTNRLKSPCL